MKYKGEWVANFDHVVEGTTFSNDLRIYSGNDLIPTDEFDDGFVYFGQVLDSPSVTGGMVASTAGHWSVDVEVGSTLDPYGYAYYSVVMNKGDYTYEVANGIVFVKKLFA